jgi:sugar lactone lactonase YvrE
VVTLTRFLLPCTAIAAFVAAVVVPALAAAGALAEPRAATNGAALVTVAPMGRLLVTTFGYAITVAALAALLGWGPGRVLGSAIARRRGHLPLAALALFPMFLPAYLVHAAWWMAWPADSAPYAWAVAHDLVGAMRRATLVLGLACWSWPIPCWCVAWAVARTPAARREMLALDGATRLDRMRDRLRSEGPALLAGALIVVLVVAADTTSFDLAQVFSFANELRALEAQGAAPRVVLGAAAPAVAIAVVGAACVWALLARSAERPAAGSRAARGAWAMATLVWTATAAAPIAILAAALFAEHPGATLAQFADFFGASLLRCAATSLAAGAAAAIVALGLAWSWADGSPVVRAMAHVQALGWVAVALVPAAAVGIGLEAAYNRDVTVVPRAILDVAPSIGAPVAGNAAGELARRKDVAGLTLADVVYLSPAIIVLGQLARFGFVAALLGRAAARGEARATRDLRRVDGATSIPAHLKAGGPALLAPIGAAGAVVTLLAAGEIAVTVRVHPDAQGSLAGRLLSAIHSQRPETVLVAALVFAAAAMIVALAAAALAALRWRSAGAAALALGALLGAGGCDGGDSAARLGAKEHAHTFGRRGLALGQFQYPRCLAIDAERDALYVVDKTARVQRFTLAGEAQAEWTMPEQANGRPTGVSVAPDGRVFVADTHYYRVIAFDPSGRELMRFGHYGEGPGEFIYPTDVAFGPEGRLYVAEYGGHDRIQIFDAAGRYLFEFGSFGAEVGQYSRPQSIVFDERGAELYIADSCNHRVVVTDAQGRVLRTIGRPGRGEGELQYPYGVTLLPGDAIAVAEFGNNRIQIFSRDGAPRGLFGGIGTAAGRLRYPWGVDHADGALYVLDSGNDRVQVTSLP